MPSLELAAFAAELLDLYTPPVRSPRTRKKMATVLGRLKALPGARTTADLTPALIARFCAGAPEGCGPNTLRGHLSYLSAACSYAVHRGYLERSPFAFRPIGGWVRPGPKVRGHHHPRSDLARALAHAGELAGSWKGGRLNALVHLVAFTGLRRDEALYLEVGDVHLAGGYLDVVPRRRLKTVGSAAPVPLPDRLVEVLSGWLPRCGGRWVFPGLRLRGPWTGGAVGERPIDRLKALGQAVGVAGLTFQSLRHSFATHAESWGLSSLLLQRILRHTVATTQEHYRHADLDNLRAAVKSIDFGPVPSPDHERVA